jgi:hypothetical protein
MISLTRISLVAFLLISICLLSYSCDEPCKFDNSSFWTPQDHGVYNCIDEDNECKALKCNLFVKGPEDGAEWESTGRTQIPRPRDMDDNKDDPNEYECRCE